MKVGQLSPLQPFACRPYISRTVGVLEHECDGAVAAAAEGRRVGLGYGGLLPPQLSVPEPATETL